MSTKTETANLSQGELPAETTLKIGEMFVTTTGCDAFGGVQHYSVRLQYATGTFEYGWFPCRVFDALWRAAQFRPTIQVPVTIIP